MATPTPTPKASASASADPKPLIVDKANPDASKDPTLVDSAPSDELKSSYKFDANVQHTADGGGTRQRELKPEEYPASLRMAPPAEQVSPNSKGTVGTPVPGLITDSADAAVAEGIEQHNKIVRDAQAEVDDTNARRTAA